DEKKAISIVTLAYRHSGGYNGDLNKAEADVRSVFNSYARESATHLYGYPRLIEIMPKVVVDRVLELLGIEKSETSYNPTDTGNGQRLVDKHKDEIRYCVDEHAWYVWDGVRWRRDVLQKMRELAKGVAADMRDEAAAMKQPTPTGDE